MANRTLPRMVAAVACAFAALAAARAGAQSITYRVGGDACDFATIQPALDAAAAHPGLDFIHIAGNTTYTAQALRMQAQDVEVTGGFATCASSTPTTGARTTISGAGGAADSVLVVLGAGDRVLRNVIITGGDETDGGNGGGVDFAGTGSLTLERVTISQNRAGFGGGISFEGSDAAELRIGSDVVIQNNVASGSGGGVRLSGNSLMLMRSSGSTITGNEALGTLPDSGYGGGLEILGPSLAQVASNGIGNFGAISFNHAKYGGGVGMPGTEVEFSKSILQLFATDPQKPGRINDNVATIQGGAVYGGVLRDFDDDNIPSLCAYEFRIDHNRAPEGAALYFQSDRKLGITYSGNIRFNVPDGFYCNVGSLPLPSPAVACAPGVPCNLIDANVAQLPNEQPSAGAIVYLDQGTILRGARFAMLGNTGNDLILERPDVDNVDPSVDLDACLLANNTLGARVLATDTGVMRNCTVAGNVLAFSSAILMSEIGEVSDSIVWQPGTIALDPLRGTITGGFVLTNDPGAFPFASTSSAEPRFIDAARGDFRLRAASPAVDFAPAVAAAADFDLDGNARDFDLPIKANGSGPRDLGAYERQSVTPLVLNGTFEGDLNLWSVATAGVTAFDADGVAGGPGSGSMKITWVNSPVISSRVTGRTQCVHLPGPGTYRLNGSGRTSGSAPPVNVQTAALAWEFRRNGGESCTTGAADRSGELNLTTGAPWFQPTTPATITVTAGEFTANSSVAVTTVVKSSGLTAPAQLQAWFDGIVLVPDDPLPPDDFVFRNGFE